SPASGAFAPDRIPTDAAPGGFRSPQGPRGMISTSSPASMARHIPPPPRPRSRDCWRGRPGRTPAPHLAASLRPCRIEPRHRPVERRGDDLIPRAAFMKKPVTAAIITIGLLVAFPPADTLGQETPRPYAEARDYTK